MSQLSFPSYRVTHSGALLRSHSGSPLQHEAAHRWNMIIISHSVNPMPVNCSGPGASCSLQEVINQHSSFGCNNGNRLKLDSKTNITSAACNISYHVTEPPPPSAVPYHLQLPRQEGRRECNSGSQLNYQAYALPRPRPPPLEAKRGEWRFICVSTARGVGGWVGAAQYWEWGWQSEDWVSACKL